MKRGWILVLGLALGVPAAPVEGSVTAPVPLRITSPTSESFTHFGFDVAVRGDTAVVSPLYRPWIAVYRQVATMRWTLEQLLSVPGTGDARPVAVSWDTIVVGVNAYGDNRGVYVFERISGIWTRTAILTSGDAEPWDLRPEGLDVDEFSGRIAIGDPSSYSPNQRGEVHTFVRRYPGGWIKESTIEAPNGSRLFGEMVALEDGRLAVGAPRDQDEPGAIFVFERSYGGWVERARLTSPTWTTFPESVAMNSGTIAAGARQLAAAAVIVFTRESGSWRREAILNVDPLNSYFFGEHVAIDGDTIVGGALRGFYEPAYPPYPVPHDAFHFPGAVYIWTRTAGLWALQTKINTPTPWDKYTWFGGSVAISESSVWVGAYGEDDVGTHDVGTVYVYPRVQHWLI